MPVTPIKSYTIKELAVLYNVSYKVFCAWLKPIRTKIGELKGKTFTPKQVKIIFEHLERPESEE
jgi:hypothetical protein